MGNTNSSNMTYNEYIISKNDLKPSYTMSELRSISRLGHIKRIFYKNNKIKDEKIKNKLMEKMNITEEEYNKIDEDLLEIKLRKVKNELIEKKLKLFMEANKNIPIYELYEELQNIFN